MTGSLSFTGSVTVPSHCTLMLGPATITGASGLPGAIPFVLGNASQLHCFGTTINGNSSGNLIDAHGTTGAVIDGCTLGGTLAGSAPNNEAININGATGLVISNTHWTGNANQMYDVTTPTDGTSIIRMGPTVAMDNDSQGQNKTAFDLLQRFAASTTTTGDNTIALQARVTVGQTNDSSDLSNASFVIPIAGYAYKNSATDVRSLFGANFSVRYYSGSALGASGRGIEVDAINSTGSDTPTTTDGAIRGYSAVGAFSGGSNRYGTGFNCAQTNGTLGFHICGYFSDYDTAGIKFQSPSTTTIPAIVVANNALNATVFKIDGAGNTTSATYSTNANCSSSASPAACAAASAGSVVIRAGTTTVQVNTTAVTANSQILVTFDETLGTKLGVTCNTASASEAATYFVGARSGGTSFTIKTNTAPRTNPACLSYSIVN